VGAAIAGVAELKMTLTSQISVLTRDVSREYVFMPLICLQYAICKDLKTSSSPVADKPPDATALWRITAIYWPNFAIAVIHQTAIG